MLNVSKASITTQKPPKVRSCCLMNAVTTELSLSEFRSNIPVQISYFICIFLNDK